MSSCGLALTSFSSHLLLGGKKLFKCFVYLKHYIAMNILRFCFWFYLGCLEKGGEPKKQNNILDLK